MRQAEKYRANRGILIASTAGLAVVAGLGLLLVWWTPLVTRGVYRMGFVFGLAAFTAILLGPAGYWDVRMLGRIPFRGTLTLVTFLAMTPYMLLIESGIAGYRGYSSWMRYVSVGVAGLGGVGLVAGFLLPRWLRR